MKRIFLPILLCFSLVVLSQGTKKVNGVSFVASRQPAEKVHVESILALNANYAAVMPFGFIREASLPRIVFDSNHQWYGETREGAGQYIDKLQQMGIKVMLKPQLWVRHGIFTGSLTMEREEDWQIMEESYRDFLLSYAILAEEKGVDILCIGTELEQFVKNREVFWNQLIKEIRKVYKGKLTYAANWDEYSRTPFWDQMDYIGIDAYFPLSDAQTPTEEELRQGWWKWKPKLKAFAADHGHQILFTEYGYRSVDFTAKKPWFVDKHDEGINMQGQVNAKRVLFEEIWCEDWFAGGFLWKWFLDHERAGGLEDNRFTPQNKPAEEVIRNYYQMY